VVTPFESAGGGKFSYMTGTGSLIDKADKLVLTNYHVVREYESVTVLFPIYENGALVTDRNKYLDQAKSGVAAKGKVLARDPTRDLALLKLDKIPHDAPVLRLAKDATGPGDRIHCLGNPGVSGGLWAYTPGDVKNIFMRKFTTSSRGGKARDSFEVECKLIENTAPTNEGDSGGPVLNNAAELVGVTQGYLGGEGARSVSYAIDLSEVKTFLKAHKLGRLLTAPATAAVTASDTATDQPKAAPPEDSKAVAARAEAIAAGKLAFAKDLLKDGKTEKAKDRLDAIVKDYPDTPAAAEARTILAKLK
jgi:S1-C subfamily serine protease